MTAIGVDGVLDMKCWEVGRGERGASKNCCSWGW